MATKKNLLEWNYLWEQVVRNFGNDRTTRQSPFVSPSQREQIYVAVTGSDDTGTGRETHPYGTIQKALEEVGDLEGPVTINVGPGTFGGFRIDNLHTSSVLRAGPSLTIRGTLETVVGPFNSTAATTSGTALNTLTVAGSNWTVDQFKGFFLQNLTTPSTAPAVIVSNTADTISFWWSTGFNTVGNSFQVVRPTTIIQGSAATFSSLNNGAIPDASEGAALVRINSSGDWGPVSGILIQSVDLVAVGTESAIRMNNSNALLRFVRISGSSTSAAVLLFRSQLNTSYCFFGGSAAVKLNSSVPAENQRFIVTGCFFDGGTGGAFGADFAFGGCYFRNHTTYGARLQGGGSSFTVCSFEGCATAIEVDEAANYTTGGYYTTFGLNGGSINNCTIGMNLASNKVTCMAKFFAVSNCTTGIIAQWGARVGVRNDFNMTSVTNEVQLDGSTTTLAAMRAASPKIIRDPNFGSAIYESTFT